jgi:glucose/arabinose dehydrogenase
MKRTTFGALLFLTLASLSAVVLAQPIPRFRYQQNYITGLSFPSLLTNAKDGSRRMFILELGGIIKVVNSGSRTPTQFMNISKRVAGGGERGLLGMAFHPQFASNGYFFLNYTRVEDGATVIARYKATTNNTLGDPDSERPVIVIPQPFDTHNGGMIEFGPDGYLYIGMGDGGSANDPGNRAQNIDELLGKFLRIAPDVSGNDANPAYTIPPDNPFVGISGADEIYAVGFRNPWRWSFDRGGSNQLWAGDVGQGAFEEVDIVTAGANYGWRVFEGDQCTGLDPGLCNPANYTPPVFTYANAGSPRCAVTGGYVYRGTRNALPYGAYVYADFCSGEILMWHNGQHTLLLDTNRNISSFGEDEDGELYVIGLGGTIDKILGNRTSADFDGDAVTDLGVFRPSDGRWYLIRSITDFFGSFHFGQDGDIPTPEDYDGDHIADFSVFRPSTSTWYFVKSKNHTFDFRTFGQPGDVPAAGDFDGDGMADINIFRPSNGGWYTLPTKTRGYTIVNWGQTGDIPLPADYDGDGRDDLTVWRPSNGTWYTILSTTWTSSMRTWGVDGDVPAPADFDGDTITDLTLFRASESRWYIWRSSDNGFHVPTWGIPGDIPVAGDYDGDGKDDVSIYRPSTGVWYRIGSADGLLPLTAWGVPGDIPLPAYDH